MSTHTLTSEDMIRGLFPCPTAFLFELLQNGHSAHATAIWVEWDEDSGIMTFRDDGRGIERFEALSTWWPSDWGAETLAEEKPSGISIMAAAVASERISIRSLKCRADFATHDFLNSIPVQVIIDTETFVQGTELRLKLTPDVRPAMPLDQNPHSETAHWLKTLADIVLGFPIPVYFNGVALPRPHALDSGLEFIWTGCGQFYVKGLRECTPHPISGQPLLYFQGLPIQRKPFGIGTSEDVLHLNPKRYHTLIRDRDMLNNSDQSLEEIATRLRELWRGRLVEHYSQIPLPEFADTYWQRCVELGLEELLRDAPLVRSMLKQHAGTVSAVRNGSDPLEDWKGEIPGRDALFIQRLDFQYDGSAGSYPAPLASRYALARSLPILEDDMPDCHWAYQRRIDLLEKELRISYALNGPVRSARFDTDWVGCEVKCCESYTIFFRPTSLCAIPSALSGALTPLTITDHAFYDPEGHCIIVPAGAGWVGDAVGQVSTYMEPSEQFCESEYLRDQDYLQSVVTHLRMNFPQAYLEDFLNRGRLDPTFLAERTYEVRYDESKKKFMVRALEIAQAP